jgi:hypothetical protein
VSKYTHEWEILATRNLKLTNTKLLKMYIARLKHSIHNELKLWKPQNVDEARSTTMLIKENPWSTKDRFEPPKKTTNCNLQNQSNNNKFQHLEREKKKENNLEIME